MAATVASTQAANFSSTSGMSPAQQVNEAIPTPNMGATPDPLPPTRKFEPSDFKLVRTLGTGE